MAQTVNRPQTIQTPSGEEMVLLSRAEYEELLSATEELEDALAAERSLARIAAGKLELSPNSEADDFLDAPTPLAFWWRKRGLTPAALAEKVGVTEEELAEIEGGREQGQVGVLRDMAAALRVTLDELLG